MVTIRGVVTNGAELGNIRYLQDPTGGLAAFPGSGSVSGFAAQVSRGDSLEVSGVLLDFNGLLEISPVTAFQVFGKAAALPEPQTFTLDAIDEDTESLLIRLEGLRFLQGGFFSGNQLYTVQDAHGAEGRVFIRNNHPLAGTAIPTGDIDMIALVSDYNGYQLLPRDTDDLIPAGELFFVDLVDQTDLSASTVSLTWRTNIPAAARIWISDDLGFIREDILSDTQEFHHYTIEGLEAATAYHIQVIAERIGLSVTGNSRWMSTASLQPGKVEVYFNQDSDPAFSNGPLPLSSSGDAVLDLLLSAIEAAQQSVDVCIYNINEVAIVQALEAAYSKGVQVRLIAASATSNTALTPPPAFPVISGNTWGLMHNKFVIFDAEDPERASVFTGSMNFTSQQIFSAYNNMVLLQDQALARAYTREFEEMWGGSGPDPDPALVRFGSAKKANTPHLFKVDGAKVALYFSPSDQTNRAIRQEIHQLSSEMQFALLTFTKDDLAEAIIERHQQGMAVRGIIDNINDNGSDYLKLLGAGVQVVDHQPSSILHHKYAILDQDRVITGSHNWSNAANTVNDENTLIIHHPAVANVFLQEFEARWGELVSTALEPPARSELQLLSVVASEGGIWIRTDLSAPQTGFWQVYDLAGRRIWQEQTTLANGPQWSVLPLSGMSAGHYALQWISASSGTGVSRLFSIF